MNRLFLLLLLIIPRCASAGHRILSPGLASLEVVVNQDWLAPLPVMRLGSSDILSIGFDELSHNYHRFVAHLEHCEADWSPSEELFESDWLEGFNDLPIEDYENSLNTTVLYTHYQMHIPNDQCRLRISGNYRLRVLDDDDGQREVLTVEFRVVEPLMHIGLSMTTNTDIALNDRYQQLAMTLNYNSVRVTNEEEQLSIVVMQNGREDNMKTDVRPDYITQKGLQWEHNRGLIFDAGNEYHKFEILDPTHTTMGLDRVWWDEEQHRYHAEPFICEPQRNYLYEEDANGAFLIRNSENTEPDRTCDYIYVHYKIRPIRQYEDADIVIQGKWTVASPDTYVMSYDEDDQSYHAILQQKMGYYNYRLLMRTADGLTHPLPEEGSFFQTGNSYQALVYYKGTGERTWRLVGYTEI